MSLVTFSSVTDSEYVNLGSLKGNRIGVFSGISIPESLKILFELISNEAEVMVTTEKETVSIPYFLKADIPLYYPDMEIDFLDRERNFFKKLFP